MESTTASRNPIGRSPDPANEGIPSPGELFAGPREPSQPTDRLVCPYCGLVGGRSDPGGPCPRCTIEDTPQTRQATKARIGPWYVLQNRNPAAPGMRWSTLLALVKKGQVTPRSVVRGPTTHQLWRLASQVKGLSREFGLCYSCGLEIARTANQCPHCDRLQEPPANPDALLESRDLPFAPTRRTISPGEFETPRPSASPAGGNSLVARPPREPRPDGGILTARELATAFQLDLQTPDGTRVPAQVQGQKLGQPPRRRGGFGKAMLLLVFLGLAGLGTWVWFTPDYRAVAARYWSTASQWTSATWQSWRAADASGAVEEPDQVASSNGTPARDATTASGEPTPPPPDDASAARREPAVTHRVEPSDDPPAPVVSVDPQVLTEQSRSLRRSAIDAEAAGDYAQAVRLYEQIRQLPREYWPSDLQVRLDAAKQRAK